MYLPVSDNRRVRCVTIQDVNSYKLTLPLLDNGLFSLTFQGVHQPAICTECTAKPYAKDFKVPKSSCWVDVFFELCGRTLW